ncbi:MAG: hypothetical protein IIC78_08830 [Chloroflexi bacterium]|nr:hypothetical protein [Chloroflexota bacterium]
MVWIKEYTSMDSELIRRYNYDEFVKEKFAPWMRFDQSPPLGILAPDFPLLHLDGTETTLSELWSKSSFLIIEFGSFT